MQVQHRRPAARIDGEDEAGQTRGADRAHRDLRRELGLSEQGLARVSHLLQVEVGAELPGRDTSYSCGRPRWLPSDGARPPLRSGGGRGRGARVDPQRGTLRVINPRRRDRIVHFEHLIDRFCLDHAFTRLCAFDARPGRGPARRAGVRAHADPR